jgi:streptogramin lyase
MRRRLLLVPLVWMAIALYAAPAGAVTPQLFALPAATEAGQISFAPDGTLWVTGRHGTEFAGGEGAFIGRWTPTGGLSELVLPEGFEIGGEATAAPDGALLLPGWTTQGSQPSVGGIVRVSASGQTQDYPLGGRFGSTAAAVPSGEGVWFAASRYKHYVERFTVGQIDAAGNFVGPLHRLHFGCEVLAMAFGPDGAAWFTESCWKHPLNRTGHRASVDEIDTAGAIVRHPIAKRFEPVSLAIGPDGSVWFGESQQFGGFGTGIGRVTQAGEVVEYRTPEGIGPGSIAVGPGGRLWFPATTGGWQTRALRSIGPAGDVSPRICLAPHCSLAPGSLITGPEGNLWFTAQGLRSPAIGGGGSGLAEDARIANQAGTIGLLPGMGGAP